MNNRIIVKVGTGVVSRQNGELDENILRDLVEQIVLARKSGTEIVLVTSGAVGAGKGMISLDGIESEVVRKQIFAAIGQVKLMQIYSHLFSAHGYHCAQVLVTKEDFRDTIHYTNMENCFRALLLDSVIPVVNENDVVATTELLFTDNDELTGLVAKQLEANAVIILTTTDGILDADKKTVREVSSTNIDQVASYIQPDMSSSGRGGMQSKFNIAKDLAESGVETYIANGKRARVLTNILEGASEGTHFSAGSKQS